MNILSQVAAEPQSVPIGDNEQMSLIFLIPIVTLAVLTGMLAFKRVIESINNKEISWKRSIVILLSTGISSSILGGLFWIVSGVFLSIQLRLLAMLAIPWLCLATILVCNDQGWPNPLAIVGKLAQVPVALLVESICLIVAGLCTTVASVIVANFLWPVLFGTDLKQIYSEHFVYEGTAVYFAILWSVMFLASYALIAKWDSGSSSSGYTSGGFTRVPDYTSPSYLSTSTPNPAAQDYSAPNYTPSQPTGPSYPGGLSQMDYGMRQTDWTNKS